MTDDDRLTVDGLRRLAVPRAGAGGDAAPALHLRSDARHEEVAECVRTWLDTAPTATEARLVIGEIELGYIQLDDLPVSSLDLPQRSVARAGYGAGDPLALPGYTELGLFRVRCPEPSCSYETSVAYLDDTVTCPDHPARALVET